MQRAKQAAIGAGIVLLVLIILIVLAAVFGVLLAALYIFLMLLAALLIIATIFQVYSILALIRTILMIREETKPLLASVQETVNIVKDTAKTAGQAVTTVGATTQLASEFALKPAIQTTAALNAGQRMLKVFFGQGHTRSRWQERRRQQMAAARGKAQ
ncbi:MAG: hypothetical protein IMW89_19180 [Ktedonobacteraceae bacterium]|nr:hypothetical protein [Ktedonobacteraceae bacterium]